MPRRVAVLAAHALLVALLLVVCGSDDRGLRIQEWEGGAGVGIGGTSANTPYSFDDATLCVATPGTVTIEEVEPERPVGGLRVTMFATRAGRHTDTAPMNRVADPKQRLRTVGYPASGAATVAGPCAVGDSPDISGTRFTTLGIEVTKPTTRTAKTTGMIITYRSGGKRLKITIPYGIILCEGQAGEDECS